MLDHYVYAANLIHNPYTEFQKAVSEIVHHINKNTLNDIFKKRSTANSLKNELCNCDEKIIDFEYIKSVKRAQGILKAGLTQLKKEVDIQDQ